jgi:hypothetical protein
MQKTYHRIAVADEVTFSKLDLSGQMLSSRHYYTIAQLYETNRLRNISPFFGYTIATDVISCVSRLLRRTRQAQAQAVFSSRL